MRDWDGPTMPTEDLELRIASLRGTLRRVLVYLDYLEELRGLPASSGPIRAAIERALEKSK